MKVAYARVSTEDQNLERPIENLKSFGAEKILIDPSVMFEAIASGDSDTTLSPWMPVTHGAFYEEDEGQFEDLGPNVEGARIGLAVPTYMDIDSIEDLEPAE